MYKLGFWLPHFWQHHFWPQIAFCKKNIFYSRFLFSLFANLYLFTLVNHCALIAIIILQSLAAGGAHHGSLALSVKTTSVMVNETLSRAVTERAAMRPIRCIKARANSGDGADVESS